MVRRARRSAFATGLAAALVSCSFTSLSGLTGGEPDGGGAAEAGPDEAQNDAAGADAVGTDAVGSDAELDAGAPFPCDAYTFCDDFGDVGFDKRWTSVVQRNGAALTRDTTHYASPPAALHATILASASTSGEARLKKTLNGVPSELVFDFDLFIDVSGTLGGVAVAAIALGTNNVVWLLVSARPDVRLNLEQVTTTDGSIVYSELFQSGFSLPLNKWTHLTVDLVFGPTTTAKVTIDRGLPASAATPHPFVPSSTIEVSLGAQHFSNAPYEAWGVYEDDVTVDVR